MWPVKLDDSELFQACSVGMRRRLFAVTNNYKHHGKFLLGDHWTANIEGACGEMVVAKFLDLHWPGYVGIPNPDLDDVGPYQVRWTQYYTGHLLLQDWDKNDRAFILVTGAAPKYHVVGWKWGHHGKQKKYLANKTGERESYWVPQSDLHSMETLPDYPKSAASKLAAKIILR